MSGAKLYINNVKPLPEGIDDKDLDYVEVTGLKSLDMKPRDFGHDFDSWDAYYEAYPELKPEYCDCCGSRV